MNLKLQPKKVLIACLSLILSLNVYESAGAFEVAQGWDRYPNDRYPNDRYPNDRYPNDRYPNDRYPNDRYPNDGYGSQIYRYNGRGQYYDGDRDYRCKTLILDFQAPRARIKCDSFQMTFQNGSVRDRNSALFYLIQVDTDRYGREEFEAEVNCDVDSTQPERFSRLRCEGTYRDRNGRSRQFQAAFDASSAGQPLPGY